MQDIFGTEFVLQEGFGRRVVREPGGRSVLKTFLAGSWDERLRLADDELSRLGRFAAALEAVPGATCPRPLGLVREPEPGFRTEWVEGEDLVVHLARVSLPAPALCRVGQTIAAALRAYVAAVGEPYHDLKLGNLLIQESGDLAFMDLGLPQGHTALDPAASPYEISVGNLLAGVLFDSARPGWLLRRRLHRQGAVIAAALVDALLDDGVPLRTDHLLDATERAYRRTTVDRGSALRSAWYPTVGRLVGIRIRLSGAHVSASSFRRR